MKHKKKGKKACISELPCSSSPLSYWSFTSFDLNRELLVKTCKKYLTDMHCILWQDWLLEPDKIADDGTVTKKGLTLAAEWLADQIFAVLALTGQTKSPYTSTDATRVQEGATPHG
jgi:hypothetical protein